MSGSQAQTPASLAWLVVFRDPQQALAWTTAEWGRVVPLARRLRLLSRLAACLEAAGLLDQVPEHQRRHLVGERRLSDWRVQAVTWGIECIARTLDGSTHPLVLLKGAAYLGQKLSIAAGRQPSDLDILVPKAHLPEVLGRLQEDGWDSGPIDAHDLRYYREWSHEMPPMTHPLHRVELDLHHNILPPVARITVDASLLLERIQPSIWPAWHVLHPVDQVLHSAAHLFLDSDLRDRVRDLVDLDGLFRYFGCDPGFWDELPKRAVQLGLTEPLALAVHFAERWMHSPIPRHVQTTINAMRPSALHRVWHLPALESALTPTAPDSVPSPRQDLAALVLLARYHYQRLPLPLLLQHAWQKFRQRLQ